MTTNSLVLSDSESEFPISVSVKKDLSFGNQAIDAYQRTYQALFDQSHLEANRLERLNHTMTLLENRLLDPEVLENLDLNQQIMLRDVLTRAQQSSIKNLTNFGVLFMNIRKVVALRDGVHRSSSPSSETHGRLSRKDPVSDFDGLEAELERE